MKKMVNGNNPNLFLPSLRDVLHALTNNNKKICLDMGISRENVVFMEVHDRRVRKMFACFFTPGREF